MGSRSGVNQTKADLVRELVAHSRRRSARDYFATVKSSDSGNSVIQDKLISL